MRGRFRTTARAAVGFLAGSLLLTGCDFDVYQLPLPGGADVGDDPIEVEVHFDDVLDLVPKSAVKVNDVTVGQVTDVDLDGYQAIVTIELRNDTELPDNAEASIRQTSLLGEKFVSLAMPADPSGDPLGDGDVIDNGGRNPEVEEVLGALSLILNGGGVAQLKTITSELNLALEGREDSARSVLRQVESLMGQLDDRKADIVNAIRSLNRLAVGARNHMDSIDRALDELPSALDSIDRQREDLVAMLQGLERLGDVGVRVIRQTKDSTMSTLRLLEPVLFQLNRAGQAFVDSLHIFYSFPFADDIIGRDPAVAKSIHFGDYVNLSIEMDLDLQTLELPGLPCVELAPANTPLLDLVKFCKGLGSALQDCLRLNQPDCAGLPGNVVDTICDATNLPVLCGLLRGNGGRTSSTGTQQALADELGLSDLQLDQLLQGILPSGLGRPRLGAPAEESLPQLDGNHDPALVSLLAGGLADGGDAR
jgi:phospholipid/cholesterol/gamma-HCH transport system substrate-binding protein